MCATAKYGQAPSYQPAAMCTRRLGFARSTVANRPATLTCCPSNSLNDHGCTRSDSTSYGRSLAYFRSTRR